MRALKNYRGVSLFNVEKIDAKMITQRLSKIIESVLLEQQTGFCKEKSCFDTVFTIN